jgi:putative NADH-flavin reductase
MKIAIYGASGWIGGTVAAEALNRDHFVTAIARETSQVKLNHKRLRVIIGDATDHASVATAVAGHDAVVAAIGGRREGRHDVVPAAVRALLIGLDRADVRRLVWVGGAGSLEVEPGIMLIDTPRFPAGLKAEASAQVAALRLFRACPEGIQWSFFSPAAQLEKGTRSGKFRIGGDQLLTDENGDSRISVQDYAVALVDEIERPMHIRRRFTIAY